MTELLPNIIKECEGKIDSLEDELRSLRSEDREYHEEERRRRERHHHDD